MKIQAHRGASKERPENSMAAFRRAAELGADGIELDVYRLKDGRLIVYHDSKLDRMTDLTGSLLDYDWETLKNVSIGRKFDERFAGETIPLFEDVLKFFAGNNLFLNCEIKNSAPGFDSGVEDDVAALLDKYGMAGRSIISSFNHEYLKNIKRKYPQFKVGILFGKPLECDVAKYCAEFGFDAIHPYWAIVDENPALVRAVHDIGVLVSVYTVDLPEQFTRMREIGVDTVITNDVATALSVLR